MMDYIKTNERLKGLDGMESLHEEGIRKTEKKMNILIMFVIAVSIVAFFI